MGPTEAVANGGPTGPLVEGTTVADLRTPVVNDYTEKERKSLGRLEESLVHLKQLLGEATKAKHLDTGTILGYKAERKRPTRTVLSTGSWQRCAVASDSPRGRDGSLSSQTSN
jgi:hypothetical protein